MKFKKITILLIGVFTQIAIAQDFDTKKLDQYFDTLEAHNKFMGSVAVSKGGKIIYTKSVGFLDVEHDKKADKNSKYRIGSISKTFTTVLIMRAAEDKLLNLNQTIEIYFPTIQNANKIIIKNLLNHRSGIHNFTDDMEYVMWHTQPKSQQEMVAIIEKAGSDFEPDTKAEYSNSNFVLLTYILEKAYNTGYADLLEKLITKPIGLKNTYLGKKINTAEQECKSYRFLNDWKPELETDISIPLGAGGIVSTTTDLAKFSEALFQGKILQAESLDMMKEIQDGYGMGLFQIPFYDKLGYGHTGGIDGFSSVFSYFREGSIAYALTSNGVNYNNNDISIAVLSAIYNKPYTIPEFSTYEVKSEDLEKYTGVYSSTQIPLKITITRDGNVLMAQASGQSSFPLEATEKDKFKFDQAGIVIEFDSEKHTLLLLQGGGQFIFNKDDK